MTRVQESIHSSSFMHSLRPILTIFTTVKVCNPHVPIGKVWIYRLLFVCFLFVSYGFPQRIRLAASNFAGRIVGIQGRESLIFVNFAPTEAQNRTNRAMNVPVGDVTACLSSLGGVTACGRKIGMCGYTSDSK